MSMMETIRGMDGTRRFLLLAGLVVLIGALAWVGRWASTPTYTTLFSDLDLKESSQVTDNLA